MLIKIPEPHLWRFLLDCLVGSQESVFLTCVLGILMIRQVWAALPEGVCRFAELGSEIFFFPVFFFLITVKLANLT